MTSRSKTVPAETPGALEAQASGCAVSVVLPTFNEAANLERMVHVLSGVLEGARCVPFEIVVVDDNSSDGTAAIADRLAAELAGKLRVIHRTGPKGLAASVCDGWQSARGEVLAVMDCDFQHPPELMARLVQATLAGADIVVASRYAPGGGTARSWSRARRMLSSTSTIVTRLSLGRLRHSLHDPLSGCFAIRRQVIEGAQLRPVGFRTLLEVLARGRYRVVREIPYTFSERTQGDSKMRLRVAFDDARQLLRVVRGRLTRRA